MKERIKTIDSLKLVAIFAIVMIHSTPFFSQKGLGESIPFLIFNQAGRFAVPAFFVLAGYLYASNFNSRRPLESYLRSTRRLGFMYVFWCLAYLIPYNIALTFGKGISAPLNFSIYHYQAWTSSWENFFLVGSKVHLWFLPALWLALTLSTPIMALKSNWLLLAVASTLFVLALLGGPYEGTRFGIDFPVLTRNGPFFSMIFFAAGVVLAGVKRTQRLLFWSYLIFFIGLIWHFAEFFWLREHYKGYFIYDFNTGTLAFGIGAAMLGIYGAKPLTNNWLQENGRYALGVYLLHLFIIDFFMPLRVPLANNFFWEVGKIFIFFLLTLWLVKALVKYPAFKRVLE